MTDERNRSKLAFEPEISLKLCAILDNVRAVGNDQVREIIHEGLSQIPEQIIVQIKRQHRQDGVQAVLDMLNKKIDQAREYEATLTEACLTSLYEQVERLKDQM